MKACGAALIGKGRASAEVEFPESRPFSAKGALLAFNGPTVGGYPEMLYYVYVDVPAPTALVVVAKLAKDSGRYAYRITVTVPELAGGSGSLSGFELTFGRKWTYKGKQHSYLSAECPSGAFRRPVRSCLRRRHRPQRQPAEQLPAAGVSPRSPQSLSSQVAAREGGAAPGFSPCLGSPRRLLVASTPASRARR